jgi:hypothetical protein
VVAIRVFFRSRSDTALEVLALRQQLAVLKRKRPRPTLNSLDRFFWTTLRQCWSRWTAVLVLVKTRHRHRLAPRRVPSLLALAIPPAGRPTEGHRGDSRSDPAIGATEPGLGSPENPWRAAEARVLCRGADCRAVSATHSASRRPCQELADVLTKSSRGDRCLRFLHRANSYIPVALLLFRDRAWASQDSALQRCAGRGLHKRGIRRTQL